MSEEAMISGIKLMDISLTGNYYFFGGLLGAAVINKIMPEIDDKEASDTPTGILVRDIVINVTLILVITYFLYTFIPRIPSPFDGVMGFQHVRLQWASGSILMAIALFALQPNLKRRMQALSVRM